MEGEVIPQLSVGRIVHYYTSDTSKHFNGIGAGPYPAIVTQTFGPHTGNLKVIAGFGGEDYHATSISANLPGGIQYPNYWEWPPRVGA